MIVWGPLVGIVTLAHLSRSWATLLAALLWHLFVVCLA